MKDTICRADAIEAVKSTKPIVRSTERNWGKMIAEQHSKELVKALKALPSAEAEPKMTEEVREALMRLTMCAREECAMCKYKDECGFDFQYKISTENMNIILDAFISAEAVQGGGRYENAMQKLREMPRYLNGVKAKQINKIPSEAVQVVRCKDCRFWKNEHLCLVMSRYGSIDTKAEHYCSWGERREP